MNNKKAIIKKIKELYDPKDAPKISIEFGDPKFELLQGGVRRINKSLTMQMDTLRDLHFKMDKLTQRVLDRMHNEEEFRAR